MIEQIRSLKVLIAGWLAFFFAMAITFDSLLYMRQFNTRGSYVALGFCGLFLSFSAAAFGISRYETKDKLRVSIES